MSSASQWRARRQAMRSKISLALLMGAAAAAACSGRQQGPPTIIVSLPTSAPTVTIPATTAPTEAPTPVAPTETPEGSGGGGEGVLPVLLADMKSDPAQVAIVDPVTGAEQGSFAAPGLTGAGAVASPLAQKLLRRRHRRLHPFLPGDCGHPGAIVGLEP